MSELRTRYYMRMMVVDSPGVLAGIAHVLGVHQNQHRVRYPEGV